GRTGRAGNMGVAVSFASHADRYQVRKIEQFTGQRIEPTVVAGYEPKRPAPRTDGPNDRPRSGAGKKPGNGYKGRNQGAQGGYRGDDSRNQNRSANPGHGFGDRKPAGNGNRADAGRGNGPFSGQKR